MYNLVTAVLIAKDKPKGFVEVDVSGMTIATLYAKYKAGYLVLTNTQLTGEMFLTLSAMKGLYLQVPNFQTTISQWLTLNGNRVIPNTLSNEPTFDFNMVHYTDVHQAGYVKQAIHPDSTISGYPVSSLTDLYISKDGVSSDILTASALFTINGYLHTHSAFNQGVKVSDGTRSILRSKSNQVGVLSFREAGGISLVNIQQGMIFKSRSDLKLYEELVINLDQDLTGKVVILSIAGQMLTLNNGFSVIDQQTGRIVLNLSRINLIDRIQEAIKWMEFPDIEASLRDWDQQSHPISVDYITSDAFILSLMRMSQTFVGLVKADYLGISKEPLNYGGLIGRLNSCSYSSRPMVDEFGRFTPYFYGGKQEHPLMPTQYVFNIPSAFSERTFNIRDRGPWKNNGTSFEAGEVSGGRVMDNSWLNMEFINQTS